MAKSPDSLQLLVSGDSWTSCWPLEEVLGHREFGWPNIVSEHFGFGLIDKSRAGSSNYRIFRKAFDGILSGDVSLVIVCLTHWTRFETGATFGPKPGRIYQHRPNDRQSTEIFRLFFNGYKIYSDILRHIIALQSLSYRTNVPCYFLDTYQDNIDLAISMERFRRILQHNFDVFDNMDDERIEQKFSVIESLTHHVDQSMFISRQSYESLVRGCELHREHPVQEGHRKIAGVIINFLESKNYGQTL